MTKEAFDARLTYSSSNSENKQTGQALRYEVGDSMSLSLGYQLVDYDLSFNWTSLITFDLKPNTDQDTAKEGYNVHNISARWMPMNVENLTVTAGI